jgi:hypothetical protein
MSNSRGGRVSDGSWSIQKDVETRFDSFSPDHAVNGVVNCRERGNAARAACGRSDLNHAMGCLVAMSVGCDFLGYNEGPLRGVEKYCCLVGMNSELSPNFYE